MKHAPWRDRVRVLRAVRREAAESDSYFARALMVEAEVLRTVGHVTAASAAQAYAASAGPEHDPDRLGHVLSAARSLDADGDRPGARTSVSCPRVRRWSASWRTCVWTPPVASHR